MDRIISKTPFYKRPGLWIFSSCIAAVMAATLIFYIWLQWVELPISSITTAEVSEQYFSKAALFDAKATAPATMVVTTNREGIVNELPVSNGDIVKPGDPLLVLSDPDFEMAIELLSRAAEDARSSVQSLQLSMENTRHSQNKSKLTVDAAIASLKSEIRSKAELAEEGFLPTQVLDNLQLELRQQIAFASLDEKSYNRMDFLMQNQLQGRLKTLAENQSKLDKALAGGMNTIISASAEGRLSDMGLRLGERVNPGFAFAEIQSIGQSVLSGKIDEFYRRDLAVGQFGSVQVDGQSYPIVLGSVNLEVKNGFMAVEWTWVDDVPENIMIGTNLRVQHNFGESAPKLVLPIDTYLSTRSGNHVYVLEVNGKAVKRNVLLGERNVDYVEIISGIQLGEVVITSSYEPMRDRTYVQIKDTYD